MDRLRYFGSSRFFQLVDHRYFRVMILLAGAMETIMLRVVRDNPVNLDSGPRYVFHTHELNQIHFEYNNNIYAECCSCLESIQTSNCHGGFMYINKLYKRMHLLFPCINGLIGTWSLSIFRLVNTSAGNFGINDWYINKIIIISWFYLKQYGWDNTTCKYTNRSYDTEYINQN